MNFLFKCFRNMRRLTILYFISPALTPKKLNKGDMIDPYEICDKLSLNKFSQIMGRKLSKKDIDEFDKGEGNIYENIDDILSPMQQISVLDNNVEFSGVGIKANMYEIM